MRKGSERGRVGRSPWAGVLYMVYRKGCDERERRVGGRERGHGALGAAFDLHGLALVGGAGTLDLGRVRRRPLLDRLGPALGVVGLRLARRVDRLLGRVRRLLERLDAAPGDGRASGGLGSEGGDGEAGRAARRGTDGVGQDVSKCLARSTAVQQRRGRIRTCGACPASESAAQHPSPCSARTRRSTVRGEAAQVSSRRHDTAPSQTTEGEDARAGRVRACPRGCPGPRAACAARAGGRSTGLGRGRACAHACGPRGGRRAGPCGLCGWGADGRAGRRETGRATGRDRRGGRGERGGSASWSGGRRWVGRPGEPRNGRLAARVERPDAPGTTETTHC